MRTDPWRYVCPSCGSQDIHLIQNKYGRRGRPAEGPDHPHFRCQSCGNRGAKYDKKRGIEVSA